MSSEGESRAYSVRKLVNDRRERWIDYITGTMTQRPWRVLAIAFAAFVAVMIVLGAVGGFKQTPPSEYEWELPFNKFSERRDMLQSADNDVDTGLLPTRSDLTYSWYFLFDSKPDLGRNTCEGPYGMVGARNVQAMCEAEMEFLSPEKYERDFCPLQDGETCTVPDSSLSRILYGVAQGTPLSEAPPSFLNCELPDQNAVADIWRNEMLPNEDEYSFFFDGKAFERGWPCRARSLMYIGTPLQGYDKPSDWDDAQFRKIQKRFVNKVQNELLDKYNMKSRPFKSAYLDAARTGESGKKFEVLWANDFLEEEQFTEAVNSDFMFAIASVLFVWFWMCVHTGSFFIGTFSILQVVISLPLSLFFYRVVLWRRYFSVMQQLVLFVILGIGADDVFVYVDAWKQSVNLIEAQGDDESDDEYIQRRTKYAYSRAFQSIFNTSFTTAVAFFATAISELIPIASFGIFAALCVIMNFALVLTVTPCVVLIHHRRKVRRQRRRQERREGSSKNLELAETKQDGETVVVKTEDIPVGEENQAIVEDEPPARKKKCLCCFGPISFCDGGWIRNYLSLIMTGNGNKETLIDGALKREAKTAQELAKARIAQLENGGEQDKRANALSILRKPVALFLVFGMAAYGVSMAVFASRLTPPNEPEVWFQRRHMATKVNKLFDDGYGSNDATYYPTLSIVWGMDKIKRGKSFDPYVPHKSRGDVKYSSNPIALHTPQAQAQVLSACDNLVTFNCESGCDGETLTQPNSTLCFLREFETWHAAEYSEPMDGLESTEFNSRLRVFRDTTTPANPDYSSWENYIGFVDNELRFIRLDSSLSMGQEESIVKKRMVIRRTNKFVSQYCRQIEDSGLPDVWQFSYAWIWYKSQQSLVTGLLTGMAIAFPVAFITLVFATQNVVLAFFAIVTIGFIVSSVLGLAWLLGWALGIKESVAGVIVIGLSVDYTIHLGHLFDSARHEQNLYSREDKFVFAMVSMGPTVLAGAVTTAGAAIFLLLCQLTFFTQMGILILATIISSLIYSLFFYMPLLYTLGPVGEFGNLTAMYHACCDKCGCCRKSPAEDTQNLR